MTIPSNLVKLLVKKELFLSINRYPVQASPRQIKVSQNDYGAYLSQKC